MFVKKVERITKTYVSKHYIKGHYFLIESRSECNSKKLIKLSSNPKD